VSVPIILNADDFAMTRGISDGIVALAEARRLSSTSAMVTTAHWATDAPALMRLRTNLAVGLHLNLTFGRPLARLPRLAPDGTFPAPNALIGRALAGNLDRAEIGAEVGRQLDRFREVAGYPPDFVDGHHHVHVLPGIRDALLVELKQRFPDAGPLLRDPSDRPASILKRKIARGKAMTVALLSVGFRRRAEAAGFSTNAGFSGFSTFGEVAYAAEFPAFLISPGERPMVMCHPGLADDELGSRDSIAHRRTEEQAYLAARTDIPETIWHPARAAAEPFPW
jgi:hypothetical protein